MSRYTMRLWLYSLYFRFWRRVLELSEILDLPDDSTPLHGRERREAEKVSAHDGRPLPEL